jgi:hypothetical protein
VADIFAQIVYASASVQTNEDSSEEDEKGTKRKRRKLSSMWDIFTDTDENQLQNLVLRFVTLSFYHR